MWLFADTGLIDPTTLATAGTPYVLAVCLLGVSSALVWVYRTYRSDVREMMDKHGATMKGVMDTHDAAMKEKRHEFVAELESMAERHDEAEGRWRADMQQQRQEFTTALKEITATFAGRMDRLEGKLFGQPK